MKTLFVFITLFLLAVSGWAGVESLVEEVNLIPVASELGLTENLAPNVIRYCEVSAGRDGESHRGKDPHICLRKDLEPVRATFMLVHELVHQKNIRPKFKAKTDFTEYVDTNIFGKGGEFEAYRAQVSAIRFLRETGKLQARYVIERFFDAELVLIDAEGFKQYLLNDLGYIEFYKRDFEARAKRL